ncbi:MAG: lipoyl synthase [Euryarchaeota archaeon]|nr:lipoyl synthase [Euryarchaeota archaeon]
MIGEKPEWLRVRPPRGDIYEYMRQEILTHNINTVCSSSQCPNKGTCWSHGHAAFMLMGTKCTRQCGFCAIDSGRPDVIDIEEPEAIAEVVKKLELNHCILTSVTRDDLPDHGANHFASTVEAIRRISHATIELLIPDMGGESEPLREIIYSNPHIIGHNLEVVKRLQPIARDPRASYEVSLSTLAMIKEIDPMMATKSSIMLGMGETLDEVRDAMYDLRGVNVDILYIGQYLRPRGGKIPVSSYVTPSEFKELEEEAYAIGFGQVVSGPLVRSSYYTGESNQSCY